MIETSKMLFVYPTYFNGQKTKAFLIVIKNPNTPYTLGRVFDMPKQNKRRRA